jgi:hypothetical protein
MAVWLAFTSGLFLGGLAGITLMCLLVLSRQDESNNSDYSSQQDD